MSPRGATVAAVPSAAVAFSAALFSARIPRQNPRNAVRGVMPSERPPLAVAARFPRVLVRAAFSQSRRSSGKEWGFVDTLRVAQFSPSHKLGGDASRSP